MEPNHMFVANLDNILNSNLAPSYLKLAILKAREFGYYSLNEFLVNVSDEDLTSVRVLFDSAILDNDDRSMNIAMLISITLAQLDGVLVEKDADAADFLKTMMMVINLESLSRKGLIEMDRTQLNFLDCGNMLVKPTEAGKNFMKNMKGDSDV